MCQIDFLQIRLSLLIAKRRSTCNFRAEAANYVASGLLSSGNVDVGTSTHVTGWGACGPNTLRVMLTLGVLVGFRAVMPNRSAFARDQQKRCWLTRHAS